MQIAKHKVVTIDYILKDNTGNVIDRSEGGNYAYLHGANDILPSLENALTGKDLGDELVVSIPSEEGYGIRDETKMHVISRDMFPADSDIEVGMQFHAQSAEGQMIVITVSEVDDDEITIDGNHAMAGMNLHFDGSVVDVREATAEDLAHGHVPAEGGCDHHH